MGNCRWLLEYEMSMNTNKDFQHALKEKEQDIQFLMLEKKDLLERNSQLQAEVSKLKLKQNEKAANSVSAASELEELRTINRILQQEKNEFVEQINVYKENKCKLVKRINHLERENEKVSMQHNLLLTTSKSDLDMRNSEVQMLKNQLIDVQSDYEKEKRTTAELKMEVVILQDKLDRAVAESLDSKVSDDPIIKEEFMEENIDEEISDSNKSLPIPTLRKKIQDTEEIKNLNEEEPIVQISKESSCDQEDEKPKKKDQQKNKPKAKRGRKKAEKAPIIKEEYMEENIDEEISDSNKSLPIPTLRKKIQDTENLISENKDLKDEETIVQVSKEDISNEVNTKEKDQQKSKKTVKRGRKKAEKDTKEENAKDAEFKEPKKTAPKKRRTTKKAANAKVSTETSLETLDENDAMQQGDASQAAKVEVSEEPKTKGKKTKTTKRKTAAKTSKSTASTKTYTIAEGSTSDINEKDDVSTTSSKQTTKKKKRISDADFVAKSVRDSKETKSTRVTRSRRK